MDGEKVTKKTKIEKIDTKEIKEYVVGKSKENDEIADDIMEGIKWMRGGAEKHFAKPKERLGCMCPKDRLIVMSGKGNIRSRICKELIEKGEISREEYKKYNKYGDVRFLREFVNEQVRDGKIFYVLKDELRKEIKGGKVVK